MNAEIFGPLVLKLRQLLRVVFPVTCLVFAGCASLAAAIRAPEPSVVYTSVIGWGAAGLHLWLSKRGTSKTSGDVHLHVAPYAEHSVVQLLDLSAQPWWRHALFGAGMLVVWTLQFAAAFMSYTVAGGFMLSLCKHHNSSPFECDTIVSMVTAGVFLLLNVVWRLLVQLAICVWRPKKAGYSVLGEVTGLFGIRLINVLFAAWARQVKLLTETGKIEYWSTLVVSDALLSAIGVLGGSWVLGRRCTRRMCSAWCCKVQESGALPPFYYRPMVDIPQAYTRAWFRWMMLNIAAATLDRSSQPWAIISFSMLVAACSLLYIMDAAVLHTTMSSLVRHTSQPTIHLPVFSIAAAVATIPLAALGIHHAAGL